MSTACRGGRILFVLLSQPSSPQPASPYPARPRPLHSPQHDAPDRTAPRADAWKPWVTYSLIAANLAMFAFELAEGANLSGATPQLMVALGGNFAPLTRNGEAWRLVTAMFLHYGAIHIAMNMVCLYQIGIVERMLGRAEFLALYFAAGLVGGLASLEIHPHAVSAGASGAVFGMFGAFAALMVVRRKQIHPSAWRRTMQSLGTFFAINLVFGLAQSAIDLSAHFGGLAVGFIGAFALAKTAGPRSRPLLRALVVAVVGAATAFGGLYALPH
ncbi:MAG: rhomboid family intramembrane serine protease [Polyangiaceae bacterium]